MGSTWDLRPIGDRFESHPEGSVYSYHRHRVPIYVYVLTSRRVFRAFLCIFDSVVLKYEPVQYSTLKNEPQVHFSTGSFFNVTPDPRWGWGVG